MNGDWKIKKISKNEYKIKTTYEDSIEETQNISIKINSSQVVSVTNATLEVSEYSSSLNEMDIDSNSKFYKERKSSRIVFGIFTAFFIICSLIISNFALLWIFISYIQLLMYIVLSSVPIGSRSKGLLVGMRFYNFFPNVFKLFLPDGKDLDFEHAEDLGYDGDFFIVNIGEILLLFAIFLIFFLGAFIIKALVDRRKIVNRIVVKYHGIILDYFRFNIPLRFVLIFYIEFCVTTFLALRSLEFKGAVESANAIISILVCILLVFGTLLIFFRIIMKYNKSEIDEEIDSNIGVLCNEIKSSKGFWRRYYYLIFSIRRVIFSIILIALKGYGTAQMVLIVIMNLVMISYLFIAKPFKDNVMNYYNILNEISISVIFILLSIFIKDISDSSIKKLDLSIFCLIYIFYAVQVLFCILYVLNVRKQVAHLNKTKNQTADNLMKTGRIEVHHLKDNKNSLEISRPEVQEWIDIPSKDNAEPDMQERQNTPLKGAASSLDNKGNDSD